jgi:hypothetical protein
MPRKMINKIRISFDEILINADFSIEPIATSWREIDFGSYISYEFISDNNILYLDFHYSKFKSDYILSNGFKLNDYIETDYSLIDCFEVELSGIIDNELNTIDILGKIVYIGNILIKRYSKIKLFVVKDISSEYNEYFNFLSIYFDLINDDNIMFLIRRK